MTQLNCQRCGKLFSVQETRNQTAKFCSKECFHPPIMKKCIRCGKEYRCQPAFKESKYCSKECYRPARTAECKKCGKSFKASPCRKAVFCSRKCSGSENKKINGLKQNICVNCKKSFFSKTAKAKYCSDGCKMIRRPKIEKTCQRCGKVFTLHKCRESITIFCSKNCLYPPLIFKTCLICGDTIKNRNNATIKQAKYCSAKCYRSYQVRNVRGSKFMLSARRRALLLRSAKGKHTNKQWQEKLNYFGGRCYLCGCSLDGKQIHKEHRIPISRGGTNFISNIAPACSKCNIKKSAKTEKEFRRIMNL